MVRREIMKIRSSSSVLAGVALAALLAACVHSGAQAQQQPAPAPPAAPPAAPMMPSAPDFSGLPMVIENGSSWLGVAIEEVSSDKAKELKLPADRGVLLTDVQQDSPAAKAGLKSGDVITEFDGQRVEGTLAFRRMVRETPPGRSVEIAYWRDGQSASVSVTLENLSGEMRDYSRQMADQARQMADMNKQMAQQMRQQIGQQMSDQPLVLNFPDDAGIFAGNTPTLGIAAQNLSGQLGNYFGAPDGQGVLVREVHDSTPASKAGLQAGDVITKLDGERVRNVSELRAKLVEKRGDKSVTLSVLRRGSELSISVEPQAPNPPNPGSDVNRHVSM
jgi:serine protease Do